MKRYLITLITIVLVFGLVGCHTETVPEEKNLEVLNTLDGSTLEKTHEIEYLKFITTYDTGDYDLSRWRITDSKTINMTAKVTNVPEGATILIEHVHIDMSLKSTNPQLDGLSQDSMDDSYHGTSQDGFWINEKYQGFGYGTEAFGARIKYAFEVLGLRRLENGYFKGRIQLFLRMFNNRSHTNKNKKA